MKHALIYTIGVLARKGGAGKSTLTLHWAVEAERQQHRVTVIDLDPQQTAVKWSQRRLQRGKQTPAMLVATAHNLQEALEACAANGLALVLI